MRRTSPLRLRPNEGCEVTTGVEIPVLSSIASGMMALTAIVFSLTFVFIQFGNTAYSPRLVMFFARDRVVLHALGVFTGVFLFVLLVERINHLTIAGVLHTIGERGRQVIDDLYALIESGVKAPEPEGEGPAPQPGDRLAGSHAQLLQAGGSVLILADVNPAVQEALRKSGTLDIIGPGNIFPATARVLDAENQAWAAAQAWLKAHEGSEE